MAGENDQFYTTKTSNEGEINQGGEKQGDLFPDRNPAAGNPLTV